MDYPTTFKELLPSIMWLIKIIKKVLIRLYLNLYYWFFLRKFYFKKRN